MRFFASNYLCQRRRVRFPFLVRDPGFVWKSASLRGRIGLVVSCLDFTEAKTASDLSRVTSYNCGKLVPP